MSTRYVDGSGMIRWKNRLRLRGNFSFPKIALISTIVAVLYITNPAHHQAIFGAPKSRGSGKRGTIRSFKLDALGVEINFKSPKLDLDWVVPKKSTDYILFSLKRKWNGVNVGMLMNQVEVCSFDGGAPLVCDWIAKHMCHGLNMFDPWYRPFTALRLIQILKLVSFALQACYLRGVLCPPASNYNIITSIASVCHQPFWYSDLPSLYLFAYPALLFLDKLTIAGTSTDEEASLHFYATVVFLFFIVGAVSNTVGSLLTKEDVRGMKGSIAAILGFVCAAKPRAIISDYNGVTLTGGDILFSTFAITATSALFGLSHFVGHWRMSDSLAWGAGGLLGYLLCSLQLEQYNIWWWSLF